MKTIDITVALETCSPCPTAAVMRMSAVAWDRYGVDTPFFLGDDRKPDPLMIFDTIVELNSQFVRGYTFDYETELWWRRQDTKLQDQVVPCDKETFTDVWNAYVNLIEWINETSIRVSADDVNIWSQSPDLDIAVLKNIVHIHSGAKFYLDFLSRIRDHKTFCHESAALICDRISVPFDEHKIDNLVEPLSNCSEHDSVDTCRAAIYSTWQMMKHMRCLTPIPQVK